MLKDRQLKKYFTEENQRILSINEMRDLHARGRSDYALCGGCDTLKEFVEAGKQRKLKSMTKSQIEIPKCPKCGSELLDPYSPGVLSVRFDEIRQCPNKKCPVVEVAISYKDKTAITKRQ